MLDNIFFVFLFSFLFKCQDRVTRCGYIFDAFYNRKKTKDIL